MAEVSVLCAYEAEPGRSGGLMLENERWDEVVLMLSPDDFLCGSAPGYFSVPCPTGGEWPASGPDYPCQSTWNIRAGWMYWAVLLIWLSSARAHPSAANIMAYAGNGWRRAFCVSYRPPETP